MRTVLVAAIIALVATLCGCAEWDEKRYQQVHQECQDDPATRIEDELMRKIATGATDVDRGSVGPHAVCMSTKSGALNEAGELNKDQIRRNLGLLIKEEQELDAAVAKCAVQKGDKEETAVHLLLCVHEVTAPHRKGRGHEHHHH